jgi:diacylglycerol O-acyltransferase
VVEDAAGATWVEDRNFDINPHVTVEKLPAHARGEQQALQERVGELAMQPLDMEAPALAVSPGRGLPGRQRR